MICLHNMRGCSMEKQLNYLEEYCNGAETRSINERLSALYKQWYNAWYEGKEKLYTDLSLNCPFLLTCTDAYIQNRIMFFGQEAHDKCSYLHDFKKELDEYFVSESYHYEKLIRYDEHGINQNFLKTRKVCAGLDPDTRFKDGEADYRRFTSVLVNNLNKISYGGKSTPVDERLRDIYSPIEFEGHKGNIFYHEMRILKPEKIIFATGSYTNHLERDFGKDVADQLRSSWKTLYLGKKGDHKVISEVSEFEYAGIKMKYIYGYHPSAHLNTDDRRNYFGAIKTFVTSS